MIQHEPVKTIRDKVGLTKIIMDIIIRHYDLSKLMVSDGNSLSTSKFWSLLSTLSESSSPYFLCRWTARLGSIIVQKRLIIVPLLIENRTIWLGSCPWIGLSYILEKLFKKWKDLGACLSGHAIFENDQYILQELFEEADSNISIPELRSTHGQVDSPASHPA